jgi:hypothetical protein
MFRSFGTGIGDRQEDGGVEGLGVRISPERSLWAISAWSSFLVVAGAVFPAWLRP